MSSFIFNFNYECFYKKYKLVCKKIEPKIIYMPFSQDTHTDHLVISKALNNTIKALTALRGSQNRYDATEAFELVYEEMQ